MKKLMIAVAILCAAVVSQAAAVTWSAAATSAVNGKTMYLLTSIAESYADAAAVASAAVDAGDVAKAGPTSYKVKQRIADDDAITKTANYYLAVISDDGKKLHYVDVTADMQALVYTPPDSAPGVYDKTSFATVAGSSLTVDVGAVPEPTSGLLLLLGVAGLALKRKQN